MTVFQALHSSPHRTPVRTLTRTIPVGVGELAVTAEPDALLVTHALGSCVAVCIWDPAALVAGLLHFLLPSSMTHSVRAAFQPAAFADTGIPMLFESAYQHGLQKSRAVVRLVGGAEVAQASRSPRQIGRRNVLAAQRILWANGVLIDHEVIGGHVPRNVYLSADNGRLRVRTGTEDVVIA